MSLQIRSSQSPVSSEESSQAWKATGAPSALQSFCSSISRIASTCWLERSAESPCIGRSETIRPSGVPLPSNSTAPQESIDSPSIDAEAAVESLAEVLSSLPQPAANTSGSAIAAMARIRAVGRFGVGFIAGSYDSGAGRTAVQSKRQDYSTGRGPPRGRE